MAPTEVAKELAESLVTVHNPVYVIFISAINQDKS